MAWIESHQSLGTHPKTRRAARLLGVSVPTLIGHLHLLWHWALDYAQDGDVSIYDPVDISEAALWDGDPALFLSALLDCGPGDSAGFFDRVDDRLVIHDWWEYAGKLLEQRAFYAERAKRKRGLYGDMDLVHAVRERDGDNCRYCDREVDWKDRKSSKGGTYDHVDPDGGNDIDNIVVACRECNSRKNRRTPEQAGMVLISRDMSARNQPEIKQRSASIPHNLNSNPYQPTVTNSNQPEENDSGVAAAVADILVAAPFVGDDVVDVERQVKRSFSLVPSFNVRDGPILAEQFVNWKGYRKKPPENWYAAWLNWLKKETNGAIPQDVRRRPVETGTTRRADYDAHVGLRSVG